MLIDEKLGVIRQVRSAPPGPGEPDALRMYNAIVNDIGRVSRWQPDTNGSGMNFDADLARHAAVGEAVERYCGNMVTRIDERASIRELRAGGRSFMDPTRVPQFTPEQHDRAGFPFTPLDEDVTIPWVLGEQRSDRSPVLLPAPLVYLNYYRGSGDPTGANRRFPVMLPGIAAGATYEKALRSALLEIIERDTTALWWIARLEATELRFPSSHPVRQLTSIGTDPAIRLWWLLLPSQFGTPTVACVLQDDALGCLAVGFATRDDVDDASLKAAAEAFQLRRICQAYVDEESWLWAGVRSGNLHFPLRPFRADRSYAKAFRADWSDMNQLMFNSQYFLDRSTWAHALDRLEARSSVSRDDLPPAVASDEAALVREFTEQEMDVYAARLTTEDVLGSGYEVARVLVPQAVPNMPTALPTLAHPRLRAALRPGDHFDLSPMPHS